MDELNELYDYSNKHLNKTKLVIVITIIIIILLFILLIFINKDEKNETYIELQSTTTTFFDKNNELCLNLPKEYHLSLVNSSDSEHILQLADNTNLNISISKNEIFTEKTLNEMLSKDINLYTKKFLNVTNLSDIQDISIGSTSGLTYSFSYTNSDNSSSYQFKSIWFQIDKICYIIDITYSEAYQERYKNLVNDISSNLTLNNTIDDNIENN